MKKVLSLLLAVILIFSVLCTVVSASETEVDYGYDVEGFAEFLNILPGNNVKLSIDRFDEAMTRLEFAGLMAGILNCAAKETNNFYFTDTAYEPAVNNLAARSIFRGDGSLFHPQRDVTVGEVYTAVIRALGYEEYTNKYGKNAVGYAMIAKDIGLIAENLDINKTATQGEVVGILTNAIRVPLLRAYAVKNDASAETSYLIYDTSDDILLLKQYHGIDIVEGVVTENEFTTLYTPRDGDEACISINDRIYNVADRGAYSYIGQNVIAYAECTDDVARGKIVHMYSDEDTNETLRINLSDIAGYDNYELSYYASDKVKRLTLPENLAVIYNGKALVGDYESYIKTGIGSLELYKDDKGGNYATMVIYSYNNAIVKSINTADSTVYFDDTVINTVDFGDNGLYYELYINKHRDTINPVQLIPGNLISLAMSQDGKYVKGYVSFESIAGAIEEIEIGTYGRSVKLKGTEYKLAMDFTPPNGFSVGYYVEAWLDVDGNIAALSYGVKDSKLTVGYVYDGAQDKNALDSVCKLKVFNEYGEQLILELAENVVFNGEKKSAELVLASLYDSRSGDFALQLVRYSLNNNLQIVKMDTAAATKQEAVNEESGSLWEMTNGFASRKYSSSQRMLMPLYPLSYKTKVFIVPTADSDFSDDKGFIVVDFQQLSPFYNTSSYNTRCYKTNTETPFVDYVVYAEPVTPSVSGKGATLMMVISKISEVWSGDESQKKITGYVRGNEISLFVDSKLDVSGLSEGDVINYVTNTSGELANMEVLYDVSSDTTSWTEYMANIYGSLRMGEVMGVYEDPMNNSQIAIALGKNGDIKDYLVINRETVKITVYDSQKTKRGTQVYMGDANHILDINQYDGSKKQKMLILKNSQYVLEIVLYK